jgi:hypothetical protein
MQFLLKNLFEEYSKKFEEIKANSYVRFLLNTNFQNVKQVFNFHSVLLLF